MTGVQTCALPIWVPVSIKDNIHVQGSVSVLLWVASCSALVDRRVLHAVRPIGADPTFQLCCFDRFDSTCGAAARTFMPAREDSVIVQMLRDDGADRKSVV